MFLFMSFFPKSPRIIHHPWLLAVIVAGWDKSSIYRYSWTPRRHPRVETSNQKKKTAERLGVWKVRWFGISCIKHSARWDFSFGVFFTSNDFGWSIRLLVALNIQQSWGCHVDGRLQPRKFRNIVENNDAWSEMLNCDRVLGWHVGPCWSYQVWR